MRLRSVPSTRACFAWACSSNFFHGGSPLGRFLPEARTRSFLAASMSLSRSRSIRSVLPSSRITVLRRSSSFSSVNSSSG